MRAKANSKLNAEECSYDTEKEKKETEKKEEEPEKETEKERIEEEKSDEGVRLNEAEKVFISNHPRCIHCNRYARPT